VGRPEAWKFYRDSRDDPELVADPGCPSGLLGGGGWLIMPLAIEAARPGPGRSTRFGTSRLSPASGLTSLLRRAMLLVTCSWGICRIRVEA